MRPDAPAFPLKLPLVPPLRLGVRTVLVHRATTRSRLTRIDVPARYAAHGGTAIVSSDLVDAWTDVSSPVAHLLHLLIPTLRRDMFHCDLLVPAARTEQSALRVEALVRATCRQLAACIKATPTKASVF